MPRTATIKYEKDKKTIKVFRISDTAEEVLEGVARGVAEEDFLTKIKDFVKEKREQITEMNLAGISLQDQDLEDIFGLCEGNNPSITGSKIGIVKHAVRFVEVIMRQKLAHENKGIGESFLDLLSLQSNIFSPELETASLAKSRNLLAREFSAQGKEFKELIKDKKCVVERDAAMLFDQNVENDDAIWDRLGNAIKDDLSRTFSEEEVRQLIAQIGNEMSGGARGELQNRLNQRPRRELFEALSAIVGGDINVQIKALLEDHKEAIIRRQDEFQSFPGDVSHSLEFPKLNKLNLENNSLTSKAMLALEYAAEMSRLPSLQELNLAENNLGSDGGKVIAQIIDYQKGQDMKLETINLRNNDIGGNTALKIAYSLKNDTKIKNINLQNNVITTSTAKEIQHYIEHNNVSLVEMDLTDSRGVTDVEVPRVIVKGFNWQSYLYGNDLVMLLGMTAAAGAFIGTKGLLKTRRVEGSTNSAAATASSLIVMYSAIANTSKSFLHDFGVKSYEAHSRIADALSVVAIAALSFSACNRWNEGINPAEDHPREDKDKHSTTYLALFVVSMALTVSLGFRKYWDYKEWGDKSDEKDKAKGERVENAMITDLHGNMPPEINFTPEQENRFYEMLIEFRNAVNNPAVEEEQGGEEQAGGLQVRVSEAVQREPDLEAPNPNTGPASGTAEQLDGVRNNTGGRF